MTDNKAHEYKLQYLHILYTWIVLCYISHTPVIPTNRILPRNLLCIVPYVCCGVIYTGELESHVSCIRKYYIKEHFVSCKKVLCKVTFRVVLYWTLVNKALTVNYRCNIRVHSQSWLCYVVSTSDIGRLHPPMSVVWCYCYECCRIFCVFLCCVVFQVYWQSS